MNYKEHIIHMQAEQFARYRNKYKEPCRKCFMYDKPLFITQMTVQKCYECTMDFLRRNDNIPAGQAK